MDSLKASAMDSINLEEIYLDVDFKDNLNCYLAFLLSYNIEVNCWFVSVMQIIFSMDVHPMQCPNLPQTRLQVQYYTFIHDRKV